MEVRKCSDMAISMEVCTKKYETLKQGRVPFHLLLRSPRRILVPSANMFTFRDSRGVPASVMGGQPSNSRVASFQRALCLSEHKIGTVFNFGSRRMFTDYIM